MAAAGAVAEAQTGLRARILGRVTDSGAQRLAGVEITFESDALQGIRRARTDAHGDFASPPLPPGDYSLSFDSPGLPTAIRRVRLSVGRTTSLDVRMGGTSSGGDTLLEDRLARGTEAAETIPGDLLEALAADRDLRTAATLAGGVDPTGPNDGLTIHGAQSWDGLFLGDGVVLNENIRGQPFGDLLIEDALVETTALTSGLSAEYGHTAGGVVSAVTRSGGNTFSGSLRARLDNEDWQGETELSGPRQNQIDATYQATFGGPILQDRLWFFLAARDQATDSTETTQRFGIPFRQEIDEERLEVKLTGTLASSHQVRGVYLEVDDRQINFAHGGLDTFAITTDDGTLQDRKLPQQALTADYSGVLGPRFFLEAQYAEREFSSRAPAAATPRSPEERRCGIWSTVLSTTSRSFAGSAGPSNATTKAPGSRLPTSCRRERPARTT